MPRKLIEQFRSEDKCREYLEDLRWPHGVRCPHCGNDSVLPAPKRAARIALKASNMNQPRVNSTLRQGDNLPQITEFYETAFDSK
jgi:hypothetical protein